MLPIKKGYVSVTCGDQSRPSPSSAMRYRSSADLNDTAKPYNGKQKQRPRNRAVPGAYYLKERIRRGTQCALANNENLPILLRQLLERRQRPFDPLCGHAVGDAHMPGTVKTAARHNEQV